MEEGGTWVGDGLGQPALGDEGGREMEVGWAAGGCESVDADDGLHSAVDQFGLENI